MPVAALQGETVLKSGKLFDQTGDGLIDDAQVQGFEDLLPILMIGRVLDKRFGFGEGLQGRRPLLSLWVIIGIYKENKYLQIKYVDTANVPH